MNIFISGISGTGMGPLALMAKDAGLNVFGSDLAEGAVAKELAEKNIEVKFGTQSGQYLREKFENGGIDWFVYTSALPQDHPELLAAKELGIKTSKRDELVAYLVEKLGLKMIAIAGTHGKTTTTAMIVWLCLNLNIPVSYLVGSTLPFAKSGSYTPGAEFFIYEADEYDRNFLHFNPYISVITVISYDHQDIYPTRESYEEAFRQFQAQSQTVIHVKTIDPYLKMAGILRRYDASLAIEAVQRIKPESRVQMALILNKFPGVGRRFERLANGIYTDYAHHPEEIKATINLALEEAKMQNKKGVIAIYEPHQNSRQHEFGKDYKDVFNGVEKIYWLPTFLTRENPSLPVLSPEQLISNLADPSIAVPAKTDQDLAQAIISHQKEGYLVLLMTAGPTDLWLRRLILGNS